MDTPLGNGLFVFVLGLLVIFLGMLVIVFSVTICGKIINKPIKIKKEEVKVETKLESAPAPIESDEFPDHIKAAIVAVISEYYFDRKSTCDFKVKKIKRI